MNIVNEDTINNDKLLSICFKNSKTAEQAFDYLISEGFNKNEITVIVSNETRDINFKNLKFSEDSLTSKVVEGIGIGREVNVKISISIDSVVSDEEVKRYKNDIEAGGILLRVKISNEKFHRIHSELNILNNLSSIMS